MRGIIVKRSKYAFCISTYFYLVGRYNAFVMGMHNYYQMSTHVACDVNGIDYQVYKTFEEQTHMKLMRYVDGKGNQYIKDRYGKSRRLKEWRGFSIVQISYVQTVPPKLKRVSVNPYLPEGRAAVHKNLRGMNLSVLYYLMRNPVMEQYVEYNDNGLSLFCGQYGKCAVSGVDLQIGDIHCHHITPIRPLQQAGLLLTNFSLIII